MKWVVAIIGAGLVFCCSMALYGVFIFAALSEIVYWEFLLAGGLAFASFTAYRSFRGTLMYYAKRPA